MESSPVGVAGEGEQPLQEALREAPALPAATAFTPDSPVSNMPLSNPWAASRGADPTPCVLAAQ